MKKLLISGLFVFLAFLTFAQVTLEKSYEYSATVVKLENSGYKYYLMDVPAAQCRIYNLDHSLYKTINCQVPNGCYLYDVKFVSENLFDSDAGLEMAYVYYKYIPTQSSYYYEYDSKIINEDGSVITSIDGALYLYVNQVAENKSQLFAYCYDFSTFPEKIWTNIYNIPGSSVSAISVEKSASDLLFNAYPNPGIESVKVAYNLPDEVIFGTLHLVDQSGNTMKTYTVDNHVDHLDVDVSDLSSGLYYYFIEYNKKRTPSKKLVIQKI